MSFKIIVHLKNFSNNFDFAFSIKLNCTIHYYMFLWIVAMLHHLLLGWLSHVFPWWCSVYGIPSIGFHFPSLRGGLNTTHTSCKLQYFPVTSIIDVEEDFFFLCDSDILPSKEEKSKSPPMFLCIKVGKPMRKSFATHTAAMVQQYGKRRKQPEYWFAVPRERCVWAETETVSQPSLSCILLFFFLKCLITFSSKTFLLMMGFRLSSRILLECLFLSGGCKIANIRSLSVTMY